MNAGSRLREVNATTLAIDGRGLRVARVYREWDADVTDPEALLAGIRSTGERIDIFSFAQRLPCSKPKYGYHMEWDNVAAIPVTTHEHWMERQIHRNARNKLKKAQKEGVVTRVVDFDDNWIRGIKEIQDEVPFRQGTPFSHYGKNLEAVRAGHSTYIDRGTCIGAFYKDEMIGYLKVVTTKGFARTMGILTKTRFNEKAPMNALIAKAVEVCATKGVPYLMYGKYSYGKVGSETLLDLKRYNGFEHILLPRYFIPLTRLGGLAMKLGAHRSLKENAPAFIVRMFLKVRFEYYERKLRAWRASQESMRNVEVPAAPADGHPA